MCVWIFFTPGIHSSTQKLASPIVHRGEIVSRALAEDNAHTSATRSRHPPAPPPPLAPARASARAERGSSRSSLRKLSISMVSGPAPAAAASRVVSKSGVCTNSTDAAEEPALADASATAGGETLAECWPAVDRSAARASRCMASLRSATATEEKHAADRRSNAVDTGSNMGSSEAFFSSRARTHAAEGFERLDGEKMLDWRSAC